MSSPGLCCLLYPVSERALPTFAHLPWLALLCLTLLKTQPAASSLWGVSWFISRGLPTRSHFLCCPCTHGISSHPQVRDTSFSSPHSRCQFALQLINTKLSGDEINTISSSGMKSSNKVLGNTENYNTLSYRVVTVEDTVFLLLLLAPHEEEGSMEWAPGDSNQGTLTQNWDASTSPDFPSQVPLDPAIKRCTNMPRIAGVKATVIRSVWGLRITPIHF